MTVRDCPLLSVTVRYCPTAGLRPQAHVASVAITDLSTPWAELAPLLTSEGGGGAAAAGGGRPWLALAAETEPLHSDAALHLNVEVSRSRTFPLSTFHFSLLEHFYPSSTLPSRTSPLPLPPIMAGAPDARAAQPSSLP